MSFWFPHGDIKGREHHLHIILTFAKRSGGGGIGYVVIEALEACWSPCEDDFSPYLSARGAECGRWRDDAQFLSMAMGGHCRWKILTIRCATVRLMPVLRLRDARFMRHIFATVRCPILPDVEVTARQLDFLARELATRPQKFNRRADSPRGLSAMNFNCLVLFLRTGAGRARHRLVRRRSQNEQRSWRYLDIINRMIDKPGSRSHQVTLLGLFSTLLQAKGTLRLHKDSATITAGGRSGNPFTSHYAFSRTAIAQSVAATADSDNQLRRTALANAGGHVVRHGARIFPSPRRLGPGGLSGRWTAHRLSLIA